MPLSRRLQRVERRRRALLAGTAHGELHHHDGQAQDDEEYEVHQHERRAAVFARDVGEAPHVAQTDGAPRGNQDEAQTRAEPFALGDARSGHVRRAGPLAVAHTIPLPMILVRNCP